MNFFLRQSITGLLKHAADTIPETRAAGTEIAQHLDRMLSVKWLDRAFDLFQQATFLSRDPVFVSGAVWTVQAMNEISRYQRRSGIMDDDERSRPAGALPGEERPRTSAGAVGATTSSPEAGAERTEQAEIEELAAREAEQGVAELFDRIRRGASLDEALALFPLLGDESEETSEK